MQEFDTKYSTHPGWYLESLSFTFLESYFVLQEFVRNGFSFKNMEFYQAFMYNLRNPPSKDILNEFQKALGKDVNGKDVDIYQLVYKLYNFNNEGEMKTYFDTRANYRLTDLLSLIVKGIGFFNWECKNSRDSSSLYLDNVLIDVFSYIQVALYAALVVDDVNVDDAKENMVAAYDPDDRASISRVIGKLPKIHKPSQLRYINEKGELTERKGPVHIELYSKVAELVNDWTDATTDLELMKQVLKLKKEDILKKDVRKVVKEIFGTSNDETVDHYFDMVLDYFYAFRSSLVYTDSNGYLKFRTDITYNVYHQTNDKLSLDHLKGAAFLIVDGKEVSLSDLTLEQIQGSWAVVHKKVGENGLMLLNKPHLTLPSGIHDGFRKQVTIDTPEGQRYKEIFYEGVVVSRYDAKKGHTYLLFGPVRLNPTTGQFEFDADLEKTEAEIAKLIEGTLDEKVLNIPFLKAEHINKYYKFESIRSACQISGSEVTYVVQKVHSKITPTDKYEGAMTGPRVIERIRQRVPLVEVNPNPRLRDLEVLKAMAQVVSQMCSKISWKAKGPEVKPLFFIEEFLNMFNDDNKYSIPWFQTVVGVGMAPKDGDPILDPTHDLYNPVIAAFWTRFINRHTVTRVGEDLKLELNDVSEKDFYSAWLTLIQNDILRSGSSGIFENYRSLLFHDDGSPKQFSDDPDFEQNEVSGLDESILMQIVNDVLVGVFGFTGFALIFSGMMSFSEDSHSWMGIKVDSLLFNIVEWLELFREFGIKALTSRRGELEPYSDDHLTEEEAIFRISSWLLSGFSYIVNVKKTTASGVDPNFKIALKITPNTDQGVLNNYFLRYEPNKPCWYTKASTIFINREYNKFTSQINLKKENTFGRGKLQELLFRKLEEKLILIFSDPDIVQRYPQYPEFQQYPEFWYEWTKGIANNIVRQYIDQPTAVMTKRLDEEIRNAIMNQRDAHINIKYESTGIIGEGIKITIPYSELLAIKDDIYYTLAFSYREKHMSPEGYFLQFSLLWSNELKSKIKEAYNKLMEMFEFGSDTFYVTFYTKFVRGITTKEGGIKDRYGKYGFISNTFDLSPQEAGSRARAAQSILFYSFMFPDIFTDVMVGPSSTAESFLLVDIFNTFSASGIGSSAMTDSRHPTSFWDESIRSDVFNYLKDHPGADKDVVLENVLMDWLDPPTKWAILNYLRGNPKATDDQLIAQFPQEDPNYLRDFNKEFKSAYVSILQYEFGQIFSPTDLRYFLGFHDAGLDTQDIETQKVMLRLIWEYFKELFEREYGIADLADLMDDDYLMRPLRLNPFPPI